MAIAVLFASVAHSFSNNVVVNDSFKYVAEQYFIGQEQHSIKTDEAAEIFQKNWDLAILVSRAEIKLKDYFGITLVYLETVENCELLMSVATKLSPEEALNRLHRFDDEWWIENEPLAKGMLCIDVVSI